MPRKRRVVKRRRLPEGVADIDLGERAHWGVYGPVVGVGSDVWPDWKTWATFYAAIRDDMFGDRIWRREKSAAERLYQAHLRGEDCDSVQSEIIAELHADDPRRLLMGGSIAT